MKERLIVVAIGTFALFSLLIVQYFKIQVVQGDRWSKQARMQHEWIVQEPFRRGAFFSNNSLKQGHPEDPKVLVFDVTKYHLMIDPLAIPEERKKEIAAHLALLSKSDAALVQGEVARKSRSRKLASWLDQKNKEAILDWWFPYAKKNKIARNAVFFATDYQRSYPFGKLMGQVLHTIRDCKEEATQHGVPTGGLEAYFNDYLKGKQGKRKFMRSPRNPLEIDKLIEIPEDGADVYLTINHYIQAVAEEELAKGVQAARAKGGWAVMMEPHTGEILALAQYPFFDPSRYRDYFNDPEKIEHAKVKALTDAFELGSIMKPLTLAICLRANETLEKEGKKPLFDPFEKIDTSRSIFPGRASKPLKDTSFHRTLNMNMSLQKSSNVYMGQLIERVVTSLGNEWYRNQLAQMFGFGQKTGVELPAEATGFLPTQGKVYPNGAIQWSLSTPYSLAMGYNLLATSLQMLRAYAIFANGGILVEPTLVRKIVKASDGKEEVLVDNTTVDRTAKFHRVISKESIKQVVRAMKFVTKPGGTARSAEIYGYSEAGKTGTAEKIEGGVYSRKRYVSSFIGFAPANFDESVPTRLVLIVTIEEPEARVLEDGRKNHHGGTCSAPVFQRIAERTLEYLGVSPDDPFGYPRGDPRCDVEKADWLKEVEEIKKLYEKWNK